MKMATQKSGLALIRIVTGLLMLYHGLELFDSAKMDEYLKWDVIKKLPVPEIMIYIGKGIELVGGIFLVLGFLTRLASLMMALNMFFICFYVGNGRFYYEDQHPFVFGLLCLVFFFNGAGIWSLDEKMSLSKVKN
ncbi:MAG: DoxX family protein [Chitinophagaceae bacterium]